MDQDRFLQALEQVHVEFRIDPESGSVQVTGYAGPPVTCGDCGLVEAASLNARRVYSYVTHVRQTRCMPCRRRLSPDGTWINYMGRPVGYTVPKE